MLSNGVTSGKMSCADSCPMAEKVRSIIYWRHPIITGVILTLLLIVEFSFMCLSAISFIAYIGLSLLVSVNLVRMYYHFVAKTENNFVREYLEREITVPQDKAEKVSRRLTEVINKGLVRTREIFLLTDPAASIKFAVLLYLLTYIGAQFNFLTLCILFTFGIFCVPKFYERYQPEIDKILELAKSKIDMVVSQVKSQIEKLPIIGGGGRKEKAQ
ncbi:Reticulon-4 isoform 2 [Schistosoma japonicum]|uniref:Reticulon-like protein n=2 Tax=Schistosoma japonicum TaxID=6182 RepID=Q5DE04_SCHJA|nr:SJCHGC02814 protein [Schistosoma japonicum]KAH8854389.1 Reticulon-1 [Schistosoma japonicum]TNN12909.1 Reticulon-4 isoform 2 [Schistosoma japonicum]CAX70331.1 Reticulon-1 [Schistosoma japonicum]